MSRKIFKKPYLTMITVLGKMFGMKRVPGNEESLPFIIVDKVNPTYNLLGVGGSKYIAAYCT